MHPVVCPSPWFQTPSKSRSLCTLQKWFSAERLRHGLTHPSIPKPSVLLVRAYPISHHLSTVFGSAQSKSVWLLSNTYGLQNWNKHPHLSSQRLVKVAWRLRSSRPTHHISHVVWSGHPIWWVSFSDLQNMHFVRHLACLSVFVQFESFILLVSFAGN